MILNILLLILGFIFLIKGADIFVDGSSSTAQNFKVPKMLIGLTIVAFGTSAPEFAVSMSALAHHNSDMVLGNVIGSCILNILLILGVAALIKPIKLKDSTIKKELPLTILISALLVVLMLDVSLAGDPINLITRLDSIVILLFFTVFIYYLVTLAKSKKDKEDEKAPFGLGKSIIFIILGLACIIMGSDLVVNNASSIAKTLGLSERVISLTIVAFGTSLPELVTTIVSSKKGEQDLLVGNIIGSNIFNICVVLGLPILIYGTIPTGAFNNLDLIMLVASAIMLLVFSKTNKTITKSNGIIMLVAFAIYYTLVFIV